MVLPYKLRVSQRSVTAANLGTQNPDFLVDYDFYFTQLPLQNPENPHETHFFH
jgi:hypothetical protein